MRDQFKNVTRKRVQALLAALVALVAASPGKSGRSVHRGDPSVN
jgi:hypothetical protein